GILRFRSIAFTEAVLFSCRTKERSGTGSHFRRAQSYIRNSMPYSLLERLFLIPDRVRATMWMPQVQHSVPFCSGLDGSSNLRPWSGSRTAAHHFHPSPTAPRWVRPESHPLPLKRHEARFGVVQARP